MISTELKVKVSAKSDAALTNQLEVQILHFWNFFFQLCLPCLQFVVLIFQNLQLCFLNSYLFCLIFLKDCVEVASTHHLGGQLERVDGGDLGVNGVFITVYELWCYIELTSLLKIITTRFKLFTIFYFYRLFKK